MDGESLRVDRKVVLLLLPILLLIVLSRLLISSLLFLCFFLCVFVLPTVFDYAIGFLSFAITCFLCTADTTIDIDADACRNDIEGWSSTYVHIYVTSYDEREGIFVFNVVSPRFSRQDTKVKINNKTKFKF